VVGDECHIVARSPAGPRGGLLAADRLDEYDNLILLCAADHRVVDAQPGTYSVAVLQSRKRRHEAWVEHLLEVKLRSAPGDGGPTFVQLERVDTGRRLLRVVGGCHAWQFDHPEPHDEAEAEAMADILQEAQDWGDIYDEIDAGGQVRAAHDLTAKIRTLARYGLSLWGGRTWAPFAPGKPPVFGWIAVLLVRRDSEEAAKKAELERLLTELQGREEPVVGG